MEWYDNYYSSSMRLIYNIPGTGYGVREMILHDEMLYDVSHGFRRWSFVFLH